VPVSEAARAMELAGEHLGPSRPPPIRRLPREDVLAIQRDRLLAATVAAVADGGYAGLTVGRILERSRVSRNTFYGIFRTSAECFCAAFDRLVDQGRVLAREAYEREASWRDGVRAALAELLSLMDEEPGPAKVCVVDVLAGDDRVLESRARVFGELAAVIDGGRELVPEGRVVPSFIAQSIVAGAFGLIHAHIVDGQDEGLGALLGRIMYMIVLPYLGASEASRELDGAPYCAVRPRAAVSNGLSSPLDGLDIRLTYRTVRVLSVTGGYPGASNREVAAQAGVLDQGQISKLLHRLARLQLIENRGLGEAKRGANSWHLTRLGAEVLRTTRPGSRV
jgi:AcrR family transcriptional regulator